jgi:hypothetical protein
MEPLIREVQLDDAEAIVRQGSLCSVAMKTVYILNVDVRQFAVYT